MRHESHLKSACLLEIKKQLPGFVVLRHEDVRTAGIPDLSLTGHGKTSWFEFKHGTPKFDSNGLQELTMLRLATVGFARYIIYLEDKSGLSKRTLIVHPKHIGDLEAEAWHTGHDHKFVVGFIRKVHYV